MTAETWYGAMAFVLLAAMAATALAAPLLLVLFRRSVQRAMYARRSAGILPAGPPASQPAAQTAPLRIELVENAREPVTDLGRELFARMLVAALCDAAVAARWEPAPLR